MENKIIRESATLAGVKLWEIADSLGMNDGNFLRLLRKELPKEQQNKILNIISQVKESRNEI